MVDIRQDSYFIYRVFFVFDCLRSDLDFLKSVDLSILNPLHLVHTRVSSVSQFLHDDEIFEPSGPLVGHLIAVAEGLAILRGLLLA